MEKAFNNMKENGLEPSIIGNTIQYITSGTKQLCIHFFNEDGSWSGKFPELH